jgi:hypothetical protein
LKLVPSSSWTPLPSLRPRSLTLVFSVLRKYFNFLRFELQSFNNFCVYSYTQALRPGVKVNLGASVDTTRLNENAHKLGLSFTLEN